MHIRMIYPNSEEENVYEVDKSCTMSKEFINPGIYDCYMDGDNTHTAFVITSSGKYGLYVGDDFNEPHVEIDTTSDTLPKQFLTEESLADSLNLYGCYYDKNKYLFIPSNITSLHCRVGDGGWCIYGALTDTYVMPLSGYTKIASYKDATCDEDIIIGYMSYSDGLNKFKVCICEAETITLDRSTFQANRDLTHIYLHNVKFTDDAYGVFAYLDALESLNVASWDTSDTVYMEGTFRNLYNYSGKLNLKGFDISNVVSMQALFYGCIGGATIDLSDFVPNEEILLTVYNIFGTYSGCNVIYSDALKQYLEEKEEYFPQ